MAYVTKANRESADYSRFDAQTGEQLHDEHGREIPDPEPMQPPVGYNRQPSLSEQMRAMIVSERLAREAASAGLETFEEADDFEIGDDWEAEKSSPYEANFDPMTPEERAALSTQGRDPERILTQEEKDALSPPKPPKKGSRGASSATPVSDPAEPGGSSEGEAEA